MYPIFIVNLKRDKQKRQHMQTLCGKYNFTPTFITAIDGTTLSEAELEACYVEHQAIQRFGRPLSRSEIGCALSHKRIYKKILSENIPYALVLEDDIIFNQDLPRLLTTVAKNNEEWELLLLGHNNGPTNHCPTAASFWHRKKIYKPYFIGRPCEIGYGTYGYLISQQGAAKMHALLEQPLHQPIDHYTGNIAHSQLRIVLPTPIVIEDALSDAFTSMDERQEIASQYTPTQQQAHAYYIQLKQKIKKLTKQLLR